MSESNSNRQWKRVPFDIEMAKKIQSGEVEGRIVLKETEVKILYFDRKIADGSSQIIVLLPTEYGDKIEYFNQDGIEVYRKELLLFIELPEEMPKQEVRAYSKEEAAAYKTGYECGIEACEKAYKYMAKKEIPKHEFKPFDKVLVRDCSKGGWQISFFSHIQDDWFITNNGHMYKECIPFAGNEHLVGTTDNPE